MLMIIILMPVSLMMISDDSAGLGAGGRDATRFKSTASP